MFNVTRAFVTFTCLILLPLHSLMASNLGVSEKYNGFFLESFNATSARIEGRLASGDTIKINNYSFGDKLEPTTAGNVVVTGGDLDYQDGRIYYGSAIAVGSIANVGNSVLLGMAEGQSVQGNQTLSFDFEEQFVHLKNVAFRLSQSPANGTSEYKWGGMYLKGDCEAPLQVFNLEGAEVLSAHTFEVTCLPDDATVIFNISGENVGFKTFSLANLIPHRTKTLYNFYQATELTLNNMEVEGSILAPYAHVNEPQGTTNGTVMAKSWNGEMHLHHFPFTGDLGFLSNPPEIISPAIFYTDEKVSYDYDVEAIDPDYNEVLTYSLDKAPQGMTVDAQTGQISWLADDSYTASTAKFNKQCYIVPEGAIEVLSEGETAKSGRNYIAPLFLRVKEAIKNASNYTGPAAVAWDKRHKCLGCHIQTQSLLGLATSQDKAEVDQNAINYLLNELITSQQSNGTILQSHTNYSITQTVMALWSLSDGLNVDVTFPIRARALDYLWTRKNGSFQIHWRQDHNTGWMKTYTATSAMVALSAGRYLSDASTQTLTANQQKTVDNWKSIVAKMAEYFLATYKNVNDGNLINSFRLIGLAELLPHIENEQLQVRIESALQFLDTELRSKQLASGAWSHSLNGTTSDPLISAWVGIAINYLHPALTDTVVLNNISYLLDSQAANGTWSTPSRLYTTALGTTSLVMSYLPVALEHLGNPDLRVSDIILTEQEEEPHRLAVTVTNRGLGDVTSPITAEFYNDDNTLLGSADIADLRSGLAQVATIGVNETDLTQDVFVRLTVSKDVEECQIGNNEVKAAIVKARVTDLFGNFDTQLLSVNVNDVNEAPVITSQPDIEHHQGQEYLYQVQVSDTDIGDAPKFLLIDPPTGLYVDERTGQIFSNPEQLQAGDYAITVQVSDLAGLTVEQTFNLTVKANQAPVITSPAVEKGLEKAGYRYQVTASDPNPNDTLTYGLEIANSGMLINKKSGLINWQADSTLVEPLISDNGLCEAPPSVITDFKVVEKWKFPKNSAANVTGPSLVAQLTDDNGDGLINSDDNTDILFFVGGGVLKAVDGETGVENFSVALGFSYISSPAIADVDGDSRPEIVVIGKNRQKLFLLEDDGTKIWEATIPSIYKSYPRDGVSIADLDADGSPEIILGNLVYSSAGQLLWKGKHDTGGEISYGIVSAVEDIDLDGFYEVIAGRTVYRHDGSVYWHRSDLSGASSGFNAVGNFDEDDQAEVVLVSNSKVYLLDTDGSTIWGPVSIPGGGFGGAPTIADVDNDGIPEIAVAGGSYYSVFDHKGKLLWKHPTQDASSNRTGSSFFDFEGDGKSEVLYADERNFFIFDGATGHVIYKQANKSGTVLEYPVVADVDNDGHAEIVFGENENASSGLRVLEGFPEWVPTRRIWNQYSYSINNINDDLSVPLTPTHPWLTHNTFRLNAFLDKPALAQADLVVHSIRYDASASLITATVKNRGLATSTATSVNFFHEHFWTQESALGAVSISEINAGEEVEISLSVDDAIIIETIRSEINSDKSATECSYDNNISKAAITEVRVYDEGKLWDKQKFAVSIKNENDAPVISSLKTSSGSEGSEYTFQVTINDPDLGDAFTYELIANEENFTINTKTGEIKGTNLVQGIYHFAIKSTDLGGLSAEQIHVVTVSEPSNNPPLLITHPDLLVNAGTEINTQIQATDPEGDEISYVLAGSPQGMSIDSASGFLRWLPDQEDLGDSWVHITAIDSNGASSTTYFKITVEDPYVGNIAPSIVSVPRGTIYAGKRFEYQVIAEDDQPLNELTFELENKVTGMAITADGLFTWLPTSVQAGQTFNIVVHVNDGRNGKGSQSLNLPANHSANNAPVITSHPTGSVIQDTLYEYIITAEDKDGDTWTATLIEGPNGLTLEGTKLVWTPSVKQTAIQHAVKIQVEDSRGAISTQLFTVWVNTPAINNDAPKILSAPTSPAMVGNVYQYQMVVSDPENDPITYQLSQSATGMSINKQGLLTWTPIVAQIGDNDVVIALSDGVNNLTHSFTLVAVAPSDPSNPNNYPVINSLPNTQASTLNSYSYQVDATDADGDVLTYSLTKAPTGMNIDANGLVTWQATAEQVMTHAVKVSVSDGQGSSIQSFNITVSDKAIPLEVSIVFTPSVINQGDSLTATIYEQGGSGEAVITATLDGKTVSLTANNKLAINSATTGSHTVTITVSKGEESVTESATFYVQDGSDTTPPVVTISAPESETNISAPTPLIGSVTDNNLKDYQVMISPKGKQQWTEIASGSSEVVDGEIAMIDPTLLMNGFYDVVILATDINGAQAQDGITILVEGELKVGHFAFTVVDMDAKVGGMPIQVSRTYDTRQRLDDLSFGFGWSVSYQDIKLSESRLLGKGWSLNKYSSGFMGTKVDWCVEPHGEPTVSIRLPDGKQEKFLVEAFPKCNAYIPITDVTFAFKSLSNSGSKLALKNKGTVRLNGQELIFLGSSKVIDPDQYILTTEDGFKYDIDQNIGIRKVEDPNGGFITYDEDGINHSSGLSIKFVRDAKGRITSVTDPRGSQVNYSYNELGELSIVTDQVGEPLNFSYLKGHYLSEIVDGKGHRYAKAIYDTDGRLIGMEDASGNRIDYQYDLVSNNQVITDDLGRSWIYLYDDFGRVTQVTDPSGIDTFYEYDLLGNETRVWNNEQSIEKSYDAKGNLVSESINGELRVSYTFDSSGRISKDEDGLGRITAYNYDSKGNTTKVIAPGGGVTNYTYTDGALTEFIDAEGNSTKITIDNSGNIGSVTNAAGHTTTYQYDSSGNKTDESIMRTVNGTQVKETEQRSYDAKNREIELVLPDGRKVSKTYDSLGGLNSILAPNGEKTNQEFDANGIPTKTNFSDGSFIAQEYDRSGNVVKEYDDKGRDTRHTYDGFDRLIKTTLPNGSTLEFSYDLLGNKIAEKDAGGQWTTFTYHPSGEVAVITDALGNATQYFYDVVGQKTSEIDALGQKTSFKYDVAGNLMTVIYPDLSEDNFQFDLLGRVTTETVKGKTKLFSYTPLGQLKSVTDELGAITYFEYDEVGNRTAVIDAQGNKTTWQYDSNRRVVKRTLPDGSAEEFIYGTNSKLESHILFDLTRVSYEYDATGKLSAKKFSDGTAIHYSTNLSGSERTIETALGVEQEFYDIDGNLLRRIDSNNNEVSYQYDSRNLKTAVTTSSGTTSYNYNALGQLSEMSYPDSKSATYSYLANGLVENILFANGVNANYLYDTLNRVTSIQYINSSAVLLQAYMYEYDEQGNVSHAWDNEFRHWNYSYDNAGKLIQEAYSAPLQAEKSTTYSYDKLGNRLIKSVDGIVVNYTYDLNNRLMSAGNKQYEYDANGNLLTVSEGLNKQSFTYNAAQQTTAIEDQYGSIQYGYDSRGLMVKRASSESESWFLQDVNQRFAQVLQTQETTSGATQDYYYGLKRNRAVGSLENHYYGIDMLGSNRLLTNELGESVAKQSYSAFGETLDGQLTDKTQFDFNGEWRDPATQLQNLRARFYSPESGRFTQMDTWAGESRNPITLNKYIYGDANPVSHVDPTGNFSMVSVMSSINLRSVLGAVGRQGYRTITKCAVTAARFYGGLGAGMLNSRANKIAFGRMIKGSGQCGVAAWNGAFAVAAKSGASVTSSQAKKVLHYNSFRQLRNHINSNLWHKKNRKTWASTFPIHHIVAQKSIFQNNLQAINSLANVVPTHAIAHGLIHYKRNGDFSQYKRGLTFKNYLNRYYKRYSQHWIINADLWRQAQLGSVDREQAEARASLL